MTLSPADTAAMQEAVLHCDLCDAAMSDAEFSQACRDTSGMDICTYCLEALIDASTFDGGTALALVGSGGGRR